MTFNPNSVFAKAMFDFDYNGLSNFFFNGIIKISVSDGFEDADRASGLVKNADYTMYPYSAEIDWTETVKNNIKDTFNILSQFFGAQFSNLNDYDTVNFSNGQIDTIANPYDVGSYSDINITFMVPDDPTLAGISGLNLDSFHGYNNSRGDIFINYTHSRLQNEGEWFSEFSLSRQVLMHEILHSLGLSHPFSSSGSTKEVKPDFRQLAFVGFQELGFKFDSYSDLNREYFTIMSYDEQSYSSFLNAYTPMIFDVIALQELYGLGQGTHGALNDQINAGTIGYRTYFDRGGIDTINLSLYSGGAYVHLGTSITGAGYSVGVIMAFSDLARINQYQDPVSLRWLYGEFENVVGGAGSDSLVGNTLDNRLEGGEGNDTLRGGAGADTLMGGAGDDRYVISDVNDLILETATEGVDTVDIAISAAGGSYTLGANIENANVTGSVAISVTGNGLDNRLFGGSENDTLQGGAGADTLNGGSGTDSLLGGLGNDYYYVISQTDYVIEISNEGYDTINLDIRSNNYQFNVPLNVEYIDNYSIYPGTVNGNIQDNFIYGYTSSDSIFGLQGNDTLRGYAGNDYVEGGEGEDRLEETLGVQGGNDTYLAGAGNDTIIEANGTNYLRGDAGDDSVFGGSGFDDINGNMGNDTAYGNDGDDWVVGGKDNDLLFGNAGFDIVYGNMGNDTVDGGAGNDWVRGGQGDDTVMGGAGDDWLWGDKGNDTLSGGAGADLFYSLAGAGIDRITDFNYAEGDRLKLEGNPARTITQSGADVIVDMGNGDQVIL
ncbi:MAG: hypothetical protein IM650_12720, partial [Phenylobacterium sp.]|uniref:hypothetical protein n=1 Tax=Phenylobacterium sp. TaxID=1871053 RepID=UPI0025D19EC0